MRAFHAIQPDNQYVFHIRNDMPPRKGEIGQDVKLKGSKAATVVVIVKGADIRYGVSRCQWEYQFCRKLAREVALGRAKQAFGGADPLKWDKHGIVEHSSIPSDPKEVYRLARSCAVELIDRISMRAVQNGYVGGDPVRISS